MRKLQLLIDFIVVFTTLTSATTVVSSIFNLKLVDAYFFLQISLANLAILAIALLVQRRQISKEQSERIGAAEEAES